VTTPPPNIPPAAPAIPLTPEVRAAYQDLYDTMQQAIDSTMDLATVQLMNQWQPQVELVLTKDDEYKLSQDTLIFAALQKQIKDVNNGLAALRTQIASIASHFAMAANIIAAIDKIFNVIAGL